MAAHSLHTCRCTTLELALQYRVQQHQQQQMVEREETHMWARLRTHQAWTGIKPQALRAHEFTHEAGS